MSAMEHALVSLSSSLDAVDHADIDDCETELVLHRLMLRDACRIHSPRGKRERDVD